MCYKTLEDDIYFYMLKLTHEFEVGKCSSYWVALTADKYVQLILLLKCYHCSKVVGLLVRKQVFLNYW